MGGKVTSFEVALKAGVSQSAVSRVFSGASASKATQEKVRQAASELGYRPNVLARSLITGRSKVIGLVVAYLDNQFYPDALERLSRALQQRGYHILVFLAKGQDDEAIEHVVGELLDYQVDGIIAASVSVSNMLTDRCDAAGIPVVLFNRGSDVANSAKVTSANVAGARKVAEFLVAGGHKRIAQVQGWSGSSTGRDRDRGFREGLKAAGAELWASGDGMYTREAASEVARSFFEAGEGPDAIFVGNDHMALAVMDTLRFDLGLKIPEDVSIVGYDDVAPAAWASYDLTTVRQPSNRMVEATVDMLLRLIEDKDQKPETIEIEGPLILRGSARIPEGWA